jgi:hypothetical protein
VSRPVKRVPERPVGSPCVMRIGWNTRGNAPRAIKCGKPSVAGWMGYFCEEHTKQMLEGRRAMKAGAFDDAFKALDAIADAEARATGGKP